MARRDGSLRGLRGAHLWLANFSRPAHAPLLGLLTRLAAVPLLVDMLVAIVSTKLPILLGHGFWGFAEPATKRLGFWSMVHEMRTDLRMVCGASFLLVAGAGALSLDARLARRLSAPRPE